MKPIVKQTLIWLVVIGALLWVRSYVGNSGGKELTPSFSDVMNKAQDGQVKDVTIEGATMVGHYAGGEQFRTTIPGHKPAMFATLSAHGVNVTVRDQGSGVWVNTLISLVPFVLLLAMPLLVLAVLLYVVRRRR